MNKKWMVICLSVILICIIIFSLTIYSPSTDNTITLELTIFSSEGIYYNNSFINITTIITNQGSRDVTIRWDLIENVDIFDNSHLNFIITDADGNSIPRVGAYHGVNEPFVLGPGKNITLNSELNEYYTLDNLNGTVSIQATYYCSILHDDDKDMLYFDGKLESNTIEITMNS
ncbi:MAG: hypothetical protein Q7J68_07840 [Thermoplasmata archaeon]|nr:hypothetical protein [Thermoplasmata archaeon]